MIVSALNRLFKEKQIPKRAEDITGMSMADMIKNYIDHDIPVIYWASIDLQETIKGPDWYLSDESRFTWISNEHCMLLVGYDDTSLYFN